MKRTTYWAAIFSIAGKVCLLFAAAYVLLPSTVEAQCGQWDVSGKWNADVIKGASEGMDLKQSGKAITGKAYFYGTAGSVKGTVEGDDFSVTIQWPGEEPGQFKVEVFIGKIAPEGKLEGTGSTLAHPDVSLKGNKWSSSRPMKCLYNTIHRLKIKPSTPTDPVGPPPAAENAPATLKVPGIIASPNNIALVAGKGSGKTTLTWDGGNNHPHAAVRVKVDDQGETTVVGASKGTLQVTVVPGKTYVYMLEDAGKVLATVTVKFHR